MTKPTKLHVRPAKTQTSLGIRPVWSLSAWRKLVSLATHSAHSEDSDQTGRMPRLIWVFAGRIVILLVLWWGSSFEQSQTTWHPCHGSDIFCYLLWRPWRVATISTVGIQLVFKEGIFIAAFKIVKVKLVIFTSLLLYCLHVGYCWMTYTPAIVNNNLYPSNCEQWLIPLQLWTMTLPLQLWSMTYTPAIMNNDLYPCNYEEWLIPCNCEQWLIPCNC